MQYVALKDGVCENDDRSGCELDGYGATGLKITYCRRTNWYY